MRRLLVQMQNFPFKESLYYLKLWGCMVVSLCIRRLSSDGPAENVELFMQHKICYGHLETRPGMKKRRKILM
jgi:hypothetical protein